MSSPEKPSLSEQLLTIKHQQKLFEQLNTSNLSVSFSPLSSSKGRLSNLDSSIGHVSYYSPTSVDWKIKTLEEQLEIALRERDNERKDNQIIRDKLSSLQNEFNAEKHLFQVAKERSTSILQESRQVTSLAEKKDIRIRDLTETKQRLERRLQDISEREHLLKRRIRDMESQQMSTKRFYEEKIQSLEKHYIQLRQLIDDQRDKSALQGRLDQKVELRLRNHEIENNLLKSQNDAQRKRIKDLQEQITNLKTQNLRSTIRSSSSMKSVETEFAGYIQAQADEIDNLRQRLSSEKAKNSDYYQSLLVNM